MTLENGAAESVTAVGTPDYVPARMVNEYVYCPRLAFLEWVDGEWDDNLDTIEGSSGFRVGDFSSIGVRDRGRRSGSKSPS